jgi:hypothetical protein|nr:MAG TPA: hypothetical protein [Caudoviricetes sp.]
MFCLSTKKSLNVFNKSLLMFMFYHYHSLIKINLLFKSLIE